MKDFLKNKLALVLEGILLLAIIVAIFSSLYLRSSSIRTSMEVNLPPERVQLIKNNIAFNQQKLEAAKMQFIPNNELARIYQEIAFNFHILGDLASAKEFYLKAVKINRLDPTVLASLFSVYKDMYDYKAARDAVKKSLDINQADWNLWRGRIELEQFHFAANRADLDRLYREALLATNNSINIITVYAKFLEEGGDKTGAFKYWKMASESAPDDPLYKEEIRRLE